MDYKMRIVAGTELYLYKIKITFYQNLDITACYRCLFLVLRAILSAYIYERSAGQLCKSRCQLGAGVYYGRLEGVGVNLGRNIARIAISSHLKLGLALPEFSKFWQCKPNEHVTCKG